MNGKKMKSSFCIYYKELMVINGLLLPSLFLIELIIPLKITGIALCGKNLTIMNKSY
jgi:hypothetical protein